MVHKGKVSSVLNDGKTVMVTPYAGGIVTAPLVVPFFLIGVLPIGTPVIYSTFDDNTGIILARTDGDWNHNFYVVPEEAGFYARIENGVCVVGCDGTADVTSTIQDGICLVYCNGDNTNVKAVIEDGVCKVSCLEG